MRSEWTNLGDVLFRKEEEAPYTHTAGESACLARGDPTTSLKCPTVMHSGHQLKEKPGGQQ